MRLSTFLSIILLIATLAACRQPSATASRDDLLNTIKDSEKSMLDNSNALTLDTAKARVVMSSYEQFLAAYPKDSLAPEILFKSAEYYKTFRQFDKSIANYKIISEQFPTYEKAPHSLFLMGFMNENDLKNLNEAKKYYQLFLQKYPQHDLADDVQFSLDNMGKTPEQIMEMLQQKQKEVQQQQNNTK
ncbi:MAG: tetratricopeptide repeat protein [Sphingobacteriales bacterium]|nr:tetratricopeptide repeat protein [Sphingobacteriales bacterium]